MRIGITGATGLVGRRLAVQLLRSGHDVIGFSRRAGPLRGLPRSVPGVQWDPGSDAPPAAFEDALSGLDALVHLAGETVAQRWTARVQRRIADSRITGTRNLVAALDRIPRRPSRFLSASAIGFYGPRGDEELDETATPGEGFLADVSKEWEAAAAGARDLGIETASLRIGVVLSPEGGALGRMLPPFRFGLGGRLGSGQQWMSWIHLDDVVGAIVHLLEAPAAGLAGVYNLTAPRPLRNALFTEALGRVLKRPTVFPVPGFGMRLLFGAMADEILLNGQRVVPHRLLEGGFRFSHPDLQPALSDLLHR